MPIVPLSPAIFIFQALLFPTPEEKSVNIINEVPA
jgi:hypothetical protein